MKKPQILTETPISMAEVKQELEKIKKRDEELSFRGTKTEEYLNQFTTLTLEDTNKLVEKLEKLDIGRLKQEHFIKLAELLPKKPEEVKAILQGYSISLTKANLELIAKTIADFK